MLQRVDARLSHVGVSFQIPGEIEKFVRIAPLAPAVMNKVPIRIDASLCDVRIALQIIVAVKKCGRLLFGVPTDLRVKARFVFCDIRTRRGRDGGRDSGVLGKVRVEPAWAALLSGTREPRGHPLGERRCQRAERPQQMIVDMMFEGPPRPSIRPAEVSCEKVALSSQS